MLSYLFTVLDASGKLPPGVLKGNFQWLGNYEECINTKSVQAASDQLLQLQGFSAHYCPVTIGPAAPMLPMVCITNWHLCFFLFYDFVQNADYILLLLIMTSESQRKRESVGGCWKDVVQWISLALVGDGKGIWLQKLCTNLPVMECTSPLSLLLSEKNTCWDGVLLL